MSTMFTLCPVFLFIVLIVPAGLAAQRWLFAGEGEVRAPEWERYQQRYDEASFQEARGSRRETRLPTWEAARGPAVHGTRHQTERAAQSIGGEEHSHVDEPSPLPHSRPGASGAGVGIPV
jgi:hypothetical protein